MIKSADRGPGRSAERLRWNVEAGGAAHGLDLIPAAIARTVSVEVDGRTIGRIPKPTPQRPWREATFLIDGQPIEVALAWHFPVMQTDVFIDGRSIRDGRSIDAARAEAPRALTNYEVWLGGLFRMPPLGSRPRPPRAWPAVVTACVAIWVVVLAASPLASSFRQVAAAALAISGLLLMLALLWTMGAVGHRVHVALLARPGLGDWRVALWFAAFIGYPLLVMLVAATLLFVLASR